MSKMPLEWHRECLINAKVHLMNQMKYFERLRGEITYIERSIAQAERQIAEAEKRGMDGFDPDRFLVTRTKR